MHKEALEEMDKGQIIRIASDLKSLFHTKEWESLIKIEQDLRYRTEKSIVNASCLDVTAEKFTVKQAYLKGMRDGLVAVWKLRDELLKSLKED